MSQLFPIYLHPKLVENFFAGSFQKIYLEILEGYRYCRFYKLLWFSEVHFEPNQTFKMEHLEH